MTRYAIRRLAWTGVVVIVISFLTFLIYFELPPNDAPYESFTHGGVTARASELTKHYLGLDRPFVAQYGLFMKHLFLGDRFGWPGLWFSFQTRAPLKPVIASRAVVTAQLAVGAAICWLLISIPIGVAAAMRPRSKLDRAVTAFAVLGVSTPVFLVGTVALYALWFKLHVAPGTGYVSIGHGVWPWFRQMILPWLTLAVSFTAYYMRMTRAALLEALGQDFVRTARAKGLSERRVVFKHALRASVTPVVTMFGMDLGQLLGGAIVTETVFNLPGLGAFAVTSLRYADLYALVDISLVVAVAIALMNLVVDLLYAAIDPRVRFA